jgi:Bacterial protein of unknown function (DUF885)
LRRDREHLETGVFAISSEPFGQLRAVARSSAHARLADELGWFSEPGTRLGMLGESALRAARVVIDIGVHLDLPLPDGSR